MFLANLLGSACDPSSIYYNADSCGWGAIAAFFVGIFAIAAIILIIELVFEVIARWIFFRKCGEGGWKSLIPVYNELTILKIAGMNWWWIFIICSIAIVYIIEAIFSSYVSYTTYWDSMFYTNPAYTAINALIRILLLAASVFVLLTRIGYSINIAKRFGKSGGFAVLIVFFEPIMFLVLGASSGAVYNKDIEVSPNGIFGRRK